MKKVLLLIDSLGSGGAQRQLVGLAVLLKQRGYDVSVATYHDDKFYVDTLLDACVPYIYIKRAHNTKRRIWAMAGYIRKVRPEWVIAFLATPSIAASIAHIFNRSFRLIVSERNTTQTIGWNERIRFRLFRTADYVVSNAYAQTRFIEEHFPWLGEKALTIVNFVDTDYFHPVERTRREVPEIVVVASIWEPKNTLGLIRAVRLMKDDGWRFHVSWYGKVGSGTEYFHQCEQLICELGVEDCISLLEKTKQIRDKYRQADYFVLPSFHEGTPNVICEAMACGLPIACSDVCDNARYVHPGENGVLFDPRSAESIAEALQGLLGVSEDVWLKYRRRSRELAVEVFSKERFVESYIELIENNLK